MSFCTVKLESLRLSLCSSRFFSSDGLLPELLDNELSLLEHRISSLLLMFLSLRPVVPCCFFACCSSFHHKLAWLPVVLSWIFTTCSLAVIPSVLFSHHWLLGSGSVSDPLQRHLVVVYSYLDASPAPPTPLLGIVPFVIVGSRYVLGLLGRVVYNNVFC